MSASDLTFTADDLAETCAILGPPPYPDEIVWVSAEDLLDLLDAEEPAA